LVLIIKKIVMWNIHFYWLFIGKTIMYNLFKEIIYSIINILFFKININYLLYNIIILLYIFSIFLFYIYIFFL